MVAVKFRKNLDQLRTWHGNVRFFRSDVKDALFPNGYTRDSTIEFAYEAATRNYRYYVLTKNRLVHNGDKGVDERRDYVEAGLRRDNANYRRSFVLPDSGGGTGVRNGESMAPGWHGANFLPMYYFQVSGDFIDQKLNNYYRDFDNPLLNGTVERRDDVVVVRTPVDDVVEEYYIDLAKGGNVTKWVNIFPLGDSITEVTVAWSFTKISDVWVPEVVERVEMPSDHSSVVSRTTLTWTENHVNDALAEDEFSLARLGSHVGDRIADHRTGGVEYASGPDLPARRTDSPPTPTRWPGLLTLGIGLAVVLFLGMVARIAAIARKRRVA